MPNREERPVAIAVLIFVIVFAFSLSAENANERALREQLAQARAELSAANARNAAIAKEAANAAARNAEALNKLKAGLDAKHSESVRQADISTATAINTGTAAAAAQAQLDVAKKAAEDARVAAETAKVQAQANRSGNASLFIMQAFMFLTVIAGFIYKALERRWDNKEVRRQEGRIDRQLMEATNVRHIHSAQLKQIKTLVDGELTEAKLKELEARRYSLAFMEEAIAADQAAGREPAATTIAMVAASKLKIDVLEKLIHERIRLTEEANAQLKIDLENPTKYE